MYDYSIRVKCDIFIVGRIYKLLDRCRQESQDESLDLESTTLPFLSSYDHLGG